MPLFINEIIAEVEPSGAQHTSDLEGGTPSGLQSSSESEWQLEEELQLMRERAQRLAVD